MGARRRRIRVVGSGAPDFEHLVARPRTRGFLGDRRAQVAQRAVRLRGRLVAAGRTRIAAPSAQASYLVQGGDGAPLDPFELVPEFSRRGRGVPVYVTLPPWAVRDRGVGRQACMCARRFGDRLASVPGVEVMNEIVLNQVVVRFGDDDETTRSVIDAVQRDGTCWLGGTVWHGRAAMRISVSNWSTTSADVDVSVDTIVRCFATVKGD